MADKYMKIFSTSLATKEMQIKISLIYHLAPVRMATSGKTKNNKCWQGCKGEKNAYTMLIGILQTLWKSV
jgi:hypothetical protein